MHKRRIAVLAGGDSSEMEVSLRSAAEVHASLVGDRFEPYIVSVSGRNWQVDGQYQVDKNDFSFTNSYSEKIVFDYALIMIHGTPGENGILQGYFEMMGIPYSTCDVCVSALTFNKSLTKELVRSLPGIHLAKEVLLERGVDIDPDAVVARLGLPLFVKPNASGSSCGVTKVKEKNQIVTAVESAFQEGGTVMLEEYIEGVEISQGVMVLGDKSWVLPITELVSKNEFFDYQAKYTPGMTDEITPARINEDLAKHVGEISLATYRRLGCRGVVRIDYIVKNDTPYFIEVNTIPGMSRNSIVPQQWRAVGLSMGEAFTMIIDASIN